MQRSKENNFAFIDSQNLYKGIVAQGWRLDYRKFRIYLREKYGVAKAYFLAVKGNVDAELVLQAMHEYQNYDKAVIVSGDGDFYCLVKYLHERDKLRRLIVPDKYKYSVLLRQSLPLSVGITFLNDLKIRLWYQGKE
ncbi:MAG: NYN domain-containing protein [Candidatus Sungbacteria bacterium]|nr:NYN domain-containing protein [Candidatus Sungbacteria bacterium]